jgi:MSHA biogenesis protein MshN
MSLINQVLLDLEKRHASESELKPLPPYVRAVPVAPKLRARWFALAAIMGFGLIALAVFIYRSGNAPDNIAATTIPRAATAPAPTPAPTSTPNPMGTDPSLRERVKTEHIAELPPPSVAFNPVSKLSEELALAAPSSAQKETQPAAVRRSKPVTAIAPLAPKHSDRSPEPAKEDPSEANRAASPDTQGKPELHVAEPATPTAPTVAAADKTPAAIDKQMRELAPQEGAEIAFRRGATQIQEGRANAAEFEFREALKQDPSHAGALQALLGLLLASGRNSDAEQLLVKALQSNPRQPRLAMVLARLEIERGEVTGAINTMVGVLPYVQSDADFYAFLAALLQREGRHREAVDYYRTALRNVHGNGVWMMGLGISLRASNQAAEARDAFASAIESKQLSPELQVFVERQLRELSVQKKN